MRGEVRYDGTLHADASRPPRGEEVMTRREAAARAGVHYNTIRSWEKNGRLTPTRIGKVVWIRRAELERVLAERD